MSIPQFVKILDRAHNGPICSVRDWDTKTIPETIKSKLERYHLVHTFDPGNPVNADDDLADRYFKAGYEMACELGVLCQDTERIIKVSEEDFDEAFRRAPSELRLGKGNDRVVMKSRRPEDGVRPLFTAPLGIVVSEDNWLPVNQGIAMQKEVDILQGASLDSVFGSPLKGGTPYETVAGRLQAQIHRDALWRAGRPGMPATAVITSPTAFGQLGGFGIPGGFPCDQNIAMVLAPAEMKTTYDALHKVAHALNMGATLMSGASPMIGGYAGPPEGAALAGIAWSVVQYVVHFADYGGCAMMDIRYNCNTNREGIWALSLAMQALSRNTDLLIQSVSNQLGGPMTKMLLWESAAIMAALSASGASVVIGPRTAGGKWANHLSPLECRFSGEVLRSAADLKRNQASKFVNGCLSHYEDRLANPDVGVPFEECYDRQTLTPKPEWMAMYTEVKGELADMGLRLVR
jgi:methylamine--corrinoid protein Co-methyltransferase